MADDESDAPRDKRGDEAREAPAVVPITPDDEPSALARGIRIFERLRRRT